MCPCLWDQGLQSFPYAILGSPLQFSFPCQLRAVIFSHLLLYVHHTDNSTCSLLAECFALLYAFKTFSTTLF